MKENLMTALKAVKEASQSLISFSEAKRNEVLLDLAKTLGEETQQIIAENKKDSNHLFGLAAAHRICQAKVLRSFYSLFSYCFYSPCPVFYNHCLQILCTLLRD